MFDLFFVYYGWVPEMVKVYRGEPVPVMFGVGEKFFGLPKNS